MSFNHSNSSGSPKPGSFTSVLETVGQILRKDPRLILLFLVPALAVVFSEFAILFYHGQLVALASQLVPGLFAHQLAFSPRFPLIFAGLLLLCITTLLVLSIVISVTVQRADAVYQDKTLSLRAAFSNAGHSLGRLIGYLLGASLVIAIGTLLLILPGIYLAIRLSVGVPAIVLDDCSIRTAVRKSWNRTRNHELQIAGLLLILAVGWLIISAFPLLGVPIAIAVIGAVSMVSSVVMFRRFDGRPMTDTRDEAPL